MFIPLGYGVNIKINNAVNFYNRHDNTVQERRYSVGFAQAKYSLFYELHLPFLYIIIGN